MGSEIGKLRKLGSEIRTLTKIGVRNRKTFKKNWDQI